jgi:N-acetylneuraminic acid mutarotase
MTTPRNDLCCVYYQGELYAIGGGDNQSKNLKSVEKFNFDKKLWELASDLLIARRSHASQVSGNHIYVMGGFDGEKYLGSVEK